MNKLLPREPAQNIDALLGLKPSSTPGLREALARRWKAWLIVAVLAVAAAVSVYALFGRSSNTVRYVTEPVTRSDLHVTVTATGSIQPTSQVEVSSELSGTIRRVFVDYNSMVKAGQVVAELDTDKFMANLDSSRAKLNAAKASVATAEVTVGEMTREYARKKTLAAAKYVSPQDLETEGDLRPRGGGADQREGGGRGGGSRCDA
jgi:HlyD family secretion protein